VLLQDRGNLEMSRNLVRRARLVQNLVPLLHSAWPSGMRGGIPGGGARLQGLAEFYDNHNDRAVSLRLLDSGEQVFLTVAKIATVIATCITSQKGFIYWRLAKKVVTSLRAVLFSSHHEYADFV
jgi:hypothetical protein